MCWGARAQRGKPRELNRKEQNKHQPEPIRRDRIAKRCNADGEAIKQTAGTFCGDHRKRNRHRQTNRERSTSQREGIADGGPKIRANGAACHGGISQIKPKQWAKPRPKRLPEAFVEAHFLAHLFYHIIAQKRIKTRHRNRLRRITGGIPKQRKGQECRARQNDKRTQQKAAEDLDHAAPSSAPNAIAASRRLLQ